MLLSINRPDNNVASSAFQYPLYGSGLLLTAGAFNSITSSPVVANATESSQLLIQTSTQEEFMITTEGLNADELTTTEDEEQFQTTTLFPPSTTTSSGQNCNYTHFDSFVQPIAEFLVNIRPLNISQYFVQIFSSISDENSVNSI